MVYISKHTYCQITVLLNYMLHIVSALLRRLGRLHKIRGLGRVSKCRMRSSKAISRPWKRLASPPAR